jgi:hypothetical protein
VLSGSVSRRTVLDSIVIHAMPTRHRLHMHTNAASTCHSVQKLAQAVQVGFPSQRPDLGPRFVHNSSPVPSRDAMKATPNFRLQSVEVQEPSEGYAAVLPGHRPSQRYMCGTEPRAIDLFKNSILPLPSVTLTGIPRPVVINHSWHDHEQRRRTSIALLSFSGQARLCS